MPRTKRVVSGKASRSRDVHEIMMSSSANASTVRLEDFENQFACMMEDLEKVYLQNVDNYKRTCKVTLMTISAQHLNQPLVENAFSGDMSNSLQSLTSASQCEESVFKIPARRVTRSHDKGRMLAPPPFHDRFRTPNCNIAPDGNRYNMITPKVQPNCPMSIMRRPHEGEMAFAMSGSPLLVSSKGNDEVANVNVPLAGGKVLSILPQSGMREYDMPEMDESTIAQLLTLRDNLNCILKRQ